MYHDVYMHRRDTVYRGVESFVQRRLDPAMLSTDVNPSFAAPVRPQVLFCVTLSCGDDGGERYKVKIKRREKKRRKKKREKVKTTVPGIPAWSPTAVLTGRYDA